MSKWKELCSLYNRDLGGNFEEELMELGQDAGWNIIQNKIHDSRFKAFLMNNFDLFLETFEYYGARSVIMPLYGDADGKAFLRKRYPELIGLLDIISQSNPDVLNKSKVAGPISTLIGIMTDKDMRKIVLEEILKAFNKIGKNFNLDDLIYCGDGNYRVAFRIKGTDKVFKIGVPEGVHFTEDGDIESGFEIEADPCFLIPDYRAIVSRKRDMSLAQAISIEIQPSAEEYPTDEEAKENADIIIESLKKRNMLWDDNIAKFRCNVMRRTTSIGPIEYGIKRRFVFRGGRKFKIYTGGFKKPELGLTEQEGFGVIGSPVLIDFGRIMHLEKTSSSGMDAQQPVSYYKVER